MIQQTKTIGFQSLAARGKWTGLLGILVLSSAPQFATAATLCVNKASGCGYTTIGGAVAAANPGDTVQVSPGVYNESVTITSSISLIGSGRGSTIINAYGLSNGIFVNGMATAPASGVSGVVISGFTIENANFEGILVANATDVTISGNLVSSNDRSLNTTNLACPNLPAFETSEGDDCGEGIHLVAVDHSVVVGNTVQNNSGGILISDETGPSHHNVISGNIVTNNPYDCGITLASHPPATMSGLMLPAGVYSNTISGNNSSNNGLQVPGAGAGVGIYAPGPGNKAYGNVIVNNTLSGNGLPGVTMHNHANVAHAPVANLNDNVIVGNQISGNAADTDDAATPGPTGINIFSQTPVTGTMIAGNSIRNEQISIAVSVPSGAVEAHANDLSGQTGVDNIGAGTISANWNYWGCVNGSGQPGCSGVMGTVLAAVSALIPF